MKDTMLAGGPDRALWAGQWAMVVNGLRYLLNGHVGARA